MASHNEAITATNCYRVPFVVFFLSQPTISKVQLAVVLLHFRSNCHSYAFSNNILACSRNHPCTRKNLRAAISKDCLRNQPFNGEFLLLINQVSAMQQGFFIDSFSYQKNFFIYPVTTCGQHKHRRIPVIDRKSSLYLFFMK